MGKIIKEQWVKIMENSGTIGNFKKIKSIIRLGLASYTYYAFEQCSINKPIMLKIVLGSCNYAQC